MRAISRALSWALITVSLAVLIATAQAASSKLSPPSDMGVDGGTLNLVDNAGTLTFSSTLWAPPPLMTCRHGHRVSPITWLVSYWDTHGRQHNVTMKLCPICYIETFSKIDVAPSVDTLVTP